ncbi:MAG: clostripain-related cysteine peptidase [Oscillospiraceae bacterium]
MKRRILTLALISAILLTQLPVNAVSPAPELDITSYYYADLLQRMGLLMGGDEGYALAQTPTRSEALVMLLRLLGREEQAREKVCSHPFSDGGWADAYIGYAYQEQLTSGISATQFGGDLPATRQQYCAFLLRALGYGDQYENAIALAEQVLCDAPKGEAHFTRGDMARLSVLALDAKLKGTEQTLAEKLIGEKALDQTDYRRERENLKRRTGEKKRTTVMIYMVASDLESIQGRATKDLQEMLRAGTHSDVTVRILAGGTATWKNSYMTGGKTQLFQLEEDAPVLVEDWGETPITAPKTLTDFVQKTAAAAPADRYVLLFWDHGKGTMGGFGKDELCDGAAMSLADMKRGLEDAQVNFDIIGFDACLMGTMETAVALKNVGEFLIASEEMTPACGWYYSTWLDALAASPQMDTLVLAKLMVDAAGIHASIETNSNSAWAITDLKRAEELGHAVEENLQKTTAAELAARSEKTAVMGAGEGGYDQYDCLDFWRDGDPRNEKLLRDAVHRAVIYQRLSSPFMAACGLAFYVPGSHREQYEEVRSVLGELGFQETYFGPFDEIGRNYSEK